jgi:2-isopropylmalate synthase
VAKNVGCTVAALCRSENADILRGWEAVKCAKRPRLHIFLATSEIHMQYKLHMTAAEVLQKTSEAVAYAKSLCGDIEFSCEDASRTSPEFLYKVLEAAIGAGATTVNIPDTVGFAIPAEFGALIRGVRGSVRGIENTVISVHCHNDLGLAVSNTLAAVENGARQVETTINGLGERAGNCPMEEFVMALTTRAASYDISHGVDTTKIYRTSQRVSSLTKVPISVCKAIVGANAFAHESGIHQHGVLANPMTYEIMTPQSIGKTESTMVLGKLSGRHAFADRLEKMGYMLTAEEINAAFARFKELADRKKTITDDDLEALANNLSDVPEYYQLDTFQIQSGNKMRSMASITLTHEGENFTEAATGDGPVDAAYNAVARIIGGEWTLTAYDIKAVTEGMDALGEVTVRVKHDGQTHVGRGLSTDIIEASILACINAINRAMVKTARSAGEAWRPAAVVV